MARYRDIAADIKTRIAAGEFAPGDQLPTITALMEHYRVPGLNTIRQAQQLLVDDGPAVRDVHAPHLLMPRFCANPAAYNSGLAVGHPRAALPVLPLD